MIFYYQMNEYIFKSKIKILKVVGFQFLIKYMDYFGILITVLLRKGTACFSPVRPQQASSRPEQAPSPGRADPGCSWMLSLAASPLINDALQGASSVSAGLNISGHDQFSLSVSLLYLIINPFPSKFHFT